MNLPPVTSIQHPKSQTVEADIQNFGVCVCVVRITTCSLEQIEQYKVQTPKFLDSDKFCIDLAL